MSEMDRLTEAVYITIDNDRRTAEYIRDYVEKMAPEIEANHKERYPDADDAARRAHVTSALADMVKAYVGEDLSLRFDGAVPNDGIHALLWSTYVSRTDWKEIARRYLEEIEED